MLYSILYSIHYTVQYTEYCILYSTGRPAVRPRDAHVARPRDELVKHREARRGADRLPSRQLAADEFRLALARNVVTVLVNVDRVLHPCPPPVDQQTAPLRGVPCELLRP